MGGMAGLLAAAGVIDRALDDLPTDPGSMAEFFASKGIKGVTCNSHECPIGRYLNGAVLDAGLDVEVGVDPNITLDADGWRTTVTAPEYVRAFVSAFDDAVWPDLIDGD